MAVFIGSILGNARNGDPHIVEETGGHMYGMQVKTYWIEIKGRD